jgi:hypothetical protein
MAIFAYVDPGTGLLAWQTVVAAFVGTLFYVKKTRDWLLRCFSRLFKRGKSSKLPEKAGQPAAKPVLRQTEPAAAQQGTSRLDESSANLLR